MMIRSSHYLKLMTISALFFSLTALVVTLGGCSSRYRHSAYLLEADGSRQRMTIIESFYTRGLGLASPFSQEFIKPGPGSLAAVSFFVRDTAQSATQKGSLIKSRGRITYRLYLPLGSELIPGDAPLRQGAFMRDHSRYNLSQSERTYLYANGKMSIDSLKSSSVYTTVDAVFRNLAGDSLAVSAEIRFRQRHNFRFSKTKYNRF